MPANRFATKARFAAWFRAVTPRTTRLFRNAYGTKRIRRGLLGREVILARNLVHFEYIHLPDNLSAAQRANALTLKLKAGSPYERPSHVAVRDGKAAQVWFWDGDTTKDVERATILPETLLHPTLEDGPHLVALSDGYEAQAWKNTALRTSRFWPRKPTEDDWRMFVRQAGFVVTEHSEPPTPMHPTWLDRPWSRVTGDEFGGWRTKAVKLWLITFMILGLALAWQGTRYLKYENHKSNLSDRIARLSTQSQSLIEARAQAQQRLSEVRTLRNKLTPTPPLQIMTDLLSAMPQSARIERFKLTNQSVKVLFHGKKVQDTSEFIRRIQTLPYVKNVNIDNVRKNQPRLTVDLKS